MHELDLRNQQCSLRCAQGFLKCRFPKIRTISWSSGNLSPAVCTLLSQARMRFLNDLRLSDQALNAAGFFGLVHASPIYTLPTTILTQWL